MHCNCSAMHCSRQSHRGRSRLDIDVCLEGTLGVARSVPVSVPERGPMAIRRQPTPAKFVRKNRPKILRFPARSCSSASLSKPPPSASRPPHRASASIRDNYTYTETLDREAVKATRLQTVAFGVKCSHTSALCRRLTIRLGAQPSGHIPGHTRRLFRWSVQNTEGNREKATVSLTVAFLR